MPSDRRVALAIVNDFLVRGFRAMLTRYAHSLMIELEDDEKKVENGGVVGLPFHDNLGYLYQYHRSMWFTLAAASDVRNDACVLQKVPTFIGR